LRSAGLKIHTEPKSLLEILVGSAVPNNSNGEKYFGYFRTKVKKKKKRKKRPRAKGGGKLK
jgi:hypothetical protein